MAQGELVPAEESRQDLRRLSHEEIFGKIREIVKESAEEAKRPILDIWFRPGVKDTERTRESVRRIALEIQKHHIESLGKVVDVYVDGITRDISGSMTGHLESKLLRLSQAARNLAEDLIMDVWVHCNEQIGEYAKLTNLPQEVRKQRAEAYLARVTNDEDLLYQISLKSVERLQAAVR